MYDWNTKELVPIASASNCKFCPVTTGMSTASWVSTLSLIGLSEAVLYPKHDHCKGFFFPSAQSRGLQGPTARSPGFRGPQPALLNRADSSEHSEMSVNAGNVYLLSQCCFLQGTYLLRAIQ